MAATRRDSAVDLAHRRSAPRALAVSLLLVFALGEQHGVAGLLRHQADGASGAALPLDR